MKKMNVVKIAGRVYECKVEKRVSKAGVEYFGGDLSVAIDEEGVNVIPVSFIYVTREYGNGGAGAKKNPNFDILDKIVSGPTWALNGKDAALKVEIDGSIALNPFVDRDGNLVTPKRVNGSFVRIVNSLKETDTNDFRVDMFINKVTRVEVNEERHIPEDYVTVRGGVFDFRETLVPVEFTVKNKDGMAYFENLDVNEKNPVFTKLWGKINCETKRTEISEESAFGTAAVRFVERKTKEWVITGTAKEVYDFDEDSADLKPSELEEAKQKLEIQLADVKKRHEDYVNSKTTTSAPASTTVPEGKWSF